MELSSLDREEYKGIPVYTMEDNKNGGLPVYIRKIPSNVPLSPIHRHEAFQINYIARGKLKHMIQQSQYNLVKGDIFVIPPYIPHRILQVEDSDFEIVELEFLPEFIFGNTATPFENPNVFNTSVFDFSYIEPFLVTECNVRPRLNLNGKKMETAEKLLDEIFEEYSNQTDGFLLALKADLLKLLVIVGRYFREEAENSDSLELYSYHREAMIKAIHYVDEHFTEPIAIEQVARIAMLSQSYFSYLFKAITHKTFVEYLNSLRIRLAMDQLKTTDSFVVDICFETGFKNVNHFNRTFKGIVGISPTQYRKCNRKKGGEAEPEG